MPASFPSTVKQFTAKVDLQDTILADHINSIQDEVRAIEITLNGTTDASNGLLTSNYAGTFAQTASWSSLDDRISNIEAGLVNGLAVSPYVKKAGDSMSVSNNTALTLKNTSATVTANLFESYNSSNTLGFALNGNALPKVGSANVLYVGSTEYNSLNATATSALNTSTDNASFSPFMLAGM